MASRWDPGGRSRTIICSGPSPMIISLRSPASTPWGLRAPGPVGSTRDPRKNQIWAPTSGRFQEGLGGMRMNTDEHMWSEL